VVYKLGGLTIGDQPGVDALLDESFSLFKKFSNDENIRGGSIADHVILGSCSPGDHRSSRVPDLHLLQQHIPVLGQLDLTCTSDQPITAKNRTGWSTNILRVPLGPRLLCMTSCRPLAALMFMASAGLLEDLCL